MTGGAVIRMRLALVAGPFGRVTIRTVRRIGNRTRLGLDLTSTAASP